MKLLISILLLAIALPAFPQSAQKALLPRYNPAAEAVYKGAVLDVRDRECPVSGGIGTHILIKLENGNTIEVHLDTTEFTKMIEMNLQKGDQIQVIGWKTELEGVQTILTREGNYGNVTHVI